MLLIRPLKPFKMYHLCPRRSTLCCLSLAYVPIRPFLLIVHTAHML